MNKMVKLFRSGFRVMLTATSRNLYRTIHSQIHYRNSSILWNRGKGINFSMLCNKTNYCPTSSSYLSVQSCSINSQFETLSAIEYEEICNETLDSLSDYFEEILENSPHLKSSDVLYSDGVLTVQLGEEYGTYVINRQSPNLQIWLSSPTSGPKRYDFDTSKKTWIYKHENRSLHQLLQEEIPAILKKDSVNFYSCSYSGAI